MPRGRTLTQTTTDRKQDGPLSEDTATVRAEASALANRLSESEGAGVDRSARGSGESATVQRETRGGGDTARSGGGEGGGGPSSLVGDVVSSSGGSLSPGIRGEMESKMGTNFSNVRVHTGPQAMKAAESIDATAFTVGNHIGFDSGADDTSSPEGKLINYMKKSLVDALKAGGSALLSGGSDEQADTGQTKQELQN